MDVGREWHSQEVAYDEGMHLLSCGWPMSSNGVDKAVILLGKGGWTCVVVAALKTSQRKLCVVSLSLNTNLYNLSGSWG
jgi:hypothetical protein